MGQILALLRGNPANGGTESSSVALPDAVAVNFSNPTVSTCEAELSKKLLALIETASSNVLPPIKSYHGCEDVIRNAISKASTENKDRAWIALVPCVTVLHACYEYAHEIEKILPAILDTACSSPSGGAQAGLLANQATAKAFVVIISFAYEFDEIKITTPSIQNDFSYYRRSLNRRKNAVSMPSQMNARDDDLAAPVTEEIANRMSLFLASPTPFLKILIDGVVGYCKRYPGQPSMLVASYILHLATICLHTATTPESPDVQKPLSTAVAMRGMTGLLVLYDHVHPSGLFLRPHTVNLRAHVRAIQTVGGTNSSSFVNALKYSTKHFASPEVPKNIKLLLEAPPTTQT